MKSARGEFVLKCWGMEFECARILKYLGNQDKLEKGREREAVGFHRLVLGVGLEPTATALLFRLGYFGDHHCILF